MKAKNRQKLETVVVTIGLVCMLWIMIVNVIQAFKCPEMTKTELLTHVPKSFVLNFNECN